MKTNNRFSTASRLISKPRINSGLWRRWLPLHRLKGIQPRLRWLSEITQPAWLSKFLITQRLSAFFHSNLRFAFLAKNPKPEHHNTSVDKLILSVIIRVCSSRSSEYNPLTPFWLPFVPMYNEPSSSSWHGPTQPYTFGVLGSLIFQLSKKKNLNWKLPGDKRL